MTNGVSQGRRISRWHRRLAFMGGLALVVAAAILVAARVPGSPRSAVDVSRAAPSTSAPAAAISLAGTPPTWAAKCLVRGGTPLPRYLGLTYAGARALARTEGDTLLLMGQAGQPHGTCSGRVAEVIPNPVDIVLGANHRVVAAECEFHPGIRCGSG
jgi:hypothetical protein